MMMVGICGGWTMQQEAGSRRTRHGMDGSSGGRSTREGDSEGP